MFRSTKTGAGVAAIALSLALVLAACGSDGDDAATNDDPSATTDVVEDSTTTEASDSTETDDETTTTEGAEVTETTDPADNPEGVDTETSELDTLPDGDHYGYIAGLENGTVEGQAVQVLIWDEVEFFMGDEATIEAKEDGAIPQDQLAIENDHYIRNENQTVRRLAVVPDASVTSLDGGSPNTVPSSVDEVWRQEYLFKINVGNVRGITTISSIEAVYLP